jgi:hypothetical protein
MTGGVTPTIHHAAALCAGLLALGCVSAGGGFEQLPADEQAMFRRCSQPLRTHLCRDGGERCLAAQEATFAVRRSPRMRRNWLTQNECPLSVMDGTDQPAASQATLLAAGATCHRSADCASDLCLGAVCVAAAGLEPGRPCAAPPVVATAAPTAPPAPQPTSEPEAAAPEETKAPEAPRPAPVADVLEKAPPAPPLALGRAPDPLRETIVGHEAEMKRCVERQLKLVPDLRAEGTLLLEVDATGKVTRAALHGEQLQGTALEGCVRAVAARWVFPRKSRAYAVEAPLRVSGVP